MHRLAPLRHAFDRLAGRPALAGFLLALAAFLSAVGAAALSGHPQPLVHDEFSYLLASDTFSHGKLANPKHPMWVFFESMHIVHDPSYASMYPPGQGLMLAAGQVTTGDPAVGIWLGIALMTGTIYWMLLGWLPPRWALVGGLLVLCKFIVLGRAAPLALGGYWSQSYFGGAVAALGGALLFGGLARIVRVRRGSSADASSSAAARKLPCPLHATFMALGVALLANSRPFEGLAVSAPAALVLLYWLWKRPVAVRKQTALRVVVPAAVVLLITFSFMGYYNHRVTGKATSMPWAHHHEQYCTFPIFVWQRPKADIHWNHKELAEFHGHWEVDLWMRHRSLDGLTIETARKFRTLWSFYIASLPRVDEPIVYTDDQVGTGLARIVRRVIAGLSAMELGLGLLMTVPLLALPWVLRHRWMLFAALCCAGVVTANLVTVAGVPHYAAPMTTMVVLLLVQCLRMLALSRRRWATVGFVLVITLTLAAYAGGFNPAWRAGKPSWHLERAKLLKQLEATPGEHLVIVRYGQGHSVHNEWVFNEADIDAAKVVWARDMGDEKNQSLVDYFTAGPTAGKGRSRQVWLIEVVNDKDPETPPKPVPVRYGKP